MFSQQQPSFYRQPRHIGNNNNNSNHLFINKIPQATPPKYLQSSTTNKSSHTQMISNYSQLQNVGYLSQSPQKKIIDQRYFNDLSINNPIQSYYIDSSHSQMMRVQQARESKVNLSLERSIVMKAYQSSTERQRIDQQNQVHDNQIKNAYIQQHKVNYSVQYKSNNPQNEISYKVFKKPINQESFILQQTGQTKEEILFIQNLQQRKKFDLLKSQKQNQSNINVFKSNNVGQVQARSSKQIVQINKKAAPLFMQSKSQNLNYTEQQNRPTSQMKTEQEKKKSKSPFFHEIFQNIKQYLKVDRLLGDGRFSKVYLSRDIRTNSLYAVKMIDKEVIIKYRMEKQIASEIKIQSYINHPNIIKMYSHFADDQHLYLVMEYASDGDLYHTLQSSVNGQMIESQTAKVIKQIALAIQQLHSMNVIHRDIKPENIMRQQDTYKLADLGCAVYSPKEARKTFCGTLDYVSPELAQGFQYSFQIDLWALGILAYELVTGEPPFFDPYHKEKNKTLQAIVEGKVAFDEGTSLEFRDFVMRLLQRDPKNRMSISSLLNHQWIQQNQEQKEVSLTM